MDQIFEVLILTPFTWLLNTFYNIFSSYGMALIFFAIVVKIVLLYFSARGKKGMMQQQRLQPKMAELQKKFGTDKQKYQQAVTELYQKEGVSMMGGCLWTLLPMPILFALYAVIREPMTRMMNIAASDIEKVANITGFFQTANDPYFQVKTAQEVHNNFATVIQHYPNTVDVDFTFLGLNLAQVPTISFDWLILIPILSGATAFLATYFSQRFSGAAAPAGNMKMMTFMMPLLSVYFGFIMPAGLGVYWIIQNALGILQDYILTRHYKKQFAIEDAKRAELEERRRAAEEQLKAEQRALKAAEIAERQQKHKGKYMVKGKPVSRPKPKLQAAQTVHPNDNEPEPEKQSEPEKPDNNNNPKPNYKKRK